ncbi:uncharacterized protein DNG_07654 [Cephalotrichum gorgonifer]|uniref:CHY-type domain-containing protein n=1 Tax=Cephalotrichum gorgonifer TaxID=2041049 RepID=A0AAE8N3Q4_9PEZI|nr:uncharacterized protein DNG_07654 [Cephalotrichum gorgonifer]
MPVRLPQGGTLPLNRTQAVAEAPAARVVAKPVPNSQADDPRGYQIAQLRRRYSPKESALDDGTTSLLFKLRPSDPDFPFNLEYLDCDLRVPAGYPGDGQPPSLHVRGSGLPRGFAINIERGWDRLVEERRGATLLALTNLLDKNLETILSEEKAGTVKMVAFRDTRHLNAPGQTPEQPAPAPPPAAAKPKPKQQKRPAYVREPSFTREEITAAKARRAQETRQLEARMGRSPLYHKSPDGIVYTLPLEPHSRAKLPPGLQGVKTMHLIIPLLYPLQQLRIQINEADAADAEPVEELFALKAAEQRKMNLTSHLNYLAVNLHVLANMAAFHARVEKKEDEERRRRGEGEGEAADVEEKAEDLASEAEEFVKSHVQVIPRPPEWSYDQGSDSESQSGSGSDWSLDGEDGGGEQSGGEHETTAPPSGGAKSRAAERGTAILFPNIELYGIELLYLSILNLSVKCDRCKTSHDITGLKDGVERADTCTKCAHPFAASFAQEPVHQHSARAGLVDVGGCTITDLLPSTFVPMCGGCSVPAAGLSAVRGDSATNVCRGCHARFTLKIPEVKFLRVSPGTLAPSAGPARTKTERLGLRAGEPLPERGTCGHYRKSHRWFRFSCCGRVYPCDKCHDEAEGHANEWASRMICGLCSREQRYAVEACGFCGRSVVGRKGHGFWEGGRGTRDRTLMSRKDGRKYKRVGGREAAGVAKE